MLNVWWEIKMDGGKRAEAGDRAGVKLARVVA